MMDNIQLNINNTLEESLEDSVISYQDVKEGFIYTIKDVSFKAKEFEKILAVLKKRYPDIKEYEFSRTKNNIFKKYIGENIRIYVHGNSIDMFGSFASKTNEDAKIVWEAYTNNVEYSNGDVHTYMYAYSLRGNQLVENAKELDVEDLNYISKNYYPYIDTDTMFDQFFTGAENILFLIGPPGVGKSKILSLAIKHAVNNPDKIPYNKLDEDSVSDHQFLTVANIKGIDVLSIDEFWSQLEKVSPDFVFIDDLDFMLTKRDADIMTQEDYAKNAFLDHFLTFTDGVEKNNTKFIITTNQPFKDIDTALLRKGRLFDILELRYLTLEEARVIWDENNLLEDDFNNTFTEDGILPADLGSEVNKRLNKRIDSSTKSYLREPGISKVERAGKKNSMSL